LFSYFLEHFKGTSIIRCHWEKQFRQKKNYLFKCSSQNFHYFFRKILEGKHLVLLDIGVKIDFNLVITTSGKVHCSQMPLYTNTPVYPNVCLGFSCIPDYRSTFCYRSLLSLSTWSKFMFYLSVQKHIFVSPFLF
jgi:hypothetical protein